MGVQANINNNHKQNYSYSPLQLVGRWGYGPNNTLSSYNEYLLCGNGSVFQVLKQSNSLELISEVTLNGIILDIVVKDHYAFVATYSYTNEDSGIFIIDLLNPGKPTKKNKIDLENLPVLDLIVNDNMLFAATDSGVLEIIDISNPTLPLLTSTFNSGSSIYSINILGNYVICCNGASGLMVVDIANNRNPKLISKINNLNGNAMRSIIKENILFVALNGNAFLVYDISDIFSIKLLNRFYLPSGTIKDIRINENYAYIAASTGGVYVIDIANLRTLQIARQLEAISGAYRFEIIGKTLFISNRLSGINSYDITSPKDLISLSEFSTYGFSNDIKFDDTNGYLCNGYYGVVVFDLSDPLKPHPAGRIIPNDHSAAQSIDVGSHYIFVSYNNNTIGIYEKLNLKQIGKFINIKRSIYNILVSKDEKYLYLPCLSEGLKIYDIQNPMTPSLIGEYPNQSKGKYFDKLSEFYDVCVDENFAYISDFHGAYYIIDIGDKSDPGFIHYIKTSNDGGNDIELIPPFLYCADGSKGVTKIDVSNPNSPNMMSINLNDTVSFGGKVKIINNYAFISNMDGGFSLLDISNPNSINVFNNFQYVGNCQSFSQRGKYVYMCDGNDGLYIYQFNTSSYISSKEINNSKFNLNQNFPNPFNPSTVISYSLLSESKVRIVVYNSLGQKVSELVNNIQPAGFYEEVFNAGSLPSGIYIYSISAQSADGKGSYMAARKMMLVK